MEKIVEHFGIGLLQILGAAGALAMFFLFLRSGGVIHTAVYNFMSSICG